MTATVGIPKPMRNPAGFLAAILVGAAVGLLVLPVLIAQAHGESIVVTPLEAKPGDSITVTGEGFPPGEEVELSLEGVRGSISLGHAEVDETGGFSTNVVIPESASAGSYQFLAATEDDSLSIDFTVLPGGAESRPTGSTELVFERSIVETITIGVIAVALAVGGTALVLVGKRRHT